MIHVSNLWIILLIIADLILFIWAIIALIRHWGVMPGWAIVLSILLILFLPGIGVIIALILIYTARDRRKMYDDDFDNSF